MAKSRRGVPGGARRTGDRAATRTAPDGRSGGATDRRLPFLLLQALAGTALLGYAAAFDSLPVLPVFAFVLLLCGVTALPVLVDRSPARPRRRY